MALAGETTPILQSDKDNKIYDVLIVGAGFSGVCMGVKLLEADRSDFVILEKTSGIGGTWYKNTYPGAACDVPSHFYSLSFAPNPNWSRIYSPQPEIKAYIEDCAARFELTPHIKLNCSVKNVIFEEDRAIWNIFTEAGDIYHARHVVMGSGGLNTPQIPDLPGLDQFEGPSFHTARWQHDVDLSDKNVVVIGSAASAIQLVPQVAKKAKHVTIFQRTPNYILPRKDRDYTAEEKNSFNKHPWKVKLTRFLQFLRFELVLTPMFKRKARLRKRFRRMFLKYLNETVSDPTLRGELIPDYEIGCKRVLISDDFYPSLNRENVSVVTNGLSKIGKNSVTDTNGAAHKADILILATGFDMKKQLTSIDLVGEGGVRLSDFWKEQALAYGGAMVPGFPNLYFVTGPNTGVGSTSVVFMIEAQAKFIMRCLKKAGSDYLLQPTLEATRQHYEKTQKDLENTVWATGCNSWYIDDMGKIHTLYPHSGGHFLLKKLRTNWRDFKLTKLK